MINWKRNLFFVWLSQILSLAGFGSVIPFIPLYMRNVLGVMDDGERGLWVSAFYFGGQLSFCISTPIWGAQRSPTASGGASCCCVQTW